MGFFNARIVKAVYRVVLQVFYQTLAYTVITAS